LNNLGQLQRKQTIKYLGHLEEVEVELLGSQGALSNVLGDSKRERENDELTDTSDLLDKILARDNMLTAMKRVIANKGSHGVDDMGYDELRGFVINNWLKVKAKLLEGKYIPSPVRRVEIPKPDGGVRLLGIPTVLDRMIQQAIAQELNKIYEPTFSDNSYGFRHKRSAKMAIFKAKEYINEGNHWVVRYGLREVLRQSQS